MKMLLVLCISSILGCVMAFGDGGGDMLSANAVFRTVRCEVSEHELDELVAFIETGFDANSKKLRVLFRPMKHSITSMRFALWYKGKKISPLFEYKGLLASGNPALFEIPMPKDIEDRLTAEDELIIRADVIFK